MLYIDSFNTIVFIYLHSLLFLKSFRVAVYKLHYRIRTHAFVRSLTSNCNFSTISLEFLWQIDFIEKVTVPNGRQKQFQVFIRRLRHLSPVLELMLYKGNISGGTTRKLVVFLSLLTASKCYSDKEILLIWWYHLRCNNKII